MRKYIGIFWAWIKKNAPILFIALFLVLAVWAQAQMSIGKSEIKKEDYHCQTLCFPQQHERIELGNTSSCWCYESETTLKKLDK